jgi:hypothetical protein
MRSPSPLVTISYYSIPAGMLGRGLIHYHRTGADAQKPPLCCGFQARLTASVRRLNTILGSVDFSVKGELRKW